jgi:hypothetical protein
VKRRYFQGTLHERLDHYTDKSGDCWLWTGTQDGKGYGLIWDNDRKSNRYAHVVAFERVHGSVPEGAVVRHFICDTPLCVRHTHLLLGTHTDNHRDMTEKRRNARGSSHGQTSLTEAMVRDIRRRYAAGEGQVSLAYHFGTSQAAISLIVNRKTWTHI